MNYKYQKKPVVVEAFQMTQERRMDNSEWPNWLHEAWHKDTHELGSLQPIDEGLDDLEIVTLEGAMLVSWDDWIILGVNGEIYPCKPDIFEKTYAKAEVDSTPPDPRHAKFGEAVWKWIQDMDVGDLYNPGIGKSLFGLAHEAGLVRLERNGDSRNEEKEEVGNG